ncbi:MAG: hypothetical protein JWM33_1828 [Caulobacteraceae bacterium]|nr:hypothetical protein [Caulobacteraceae bacterium]
MKASIKIAGLAIAGLAVGSVNAAAPSPTPTPSPGNSAGYVAARAIVHLGAKPFLVLWANTSLGDYTYVTAFYRDPPLGADRAPVWTIRRVQASKYNQPETVSWARSSECPAAGVAVDGLSKLSLPMVRLPPAKGVSPPAPMTDGTDYRLWPSVRGQWGEGASEDQDLRNEPSLDAWWRQFSIQLASCWNDGELT